MRATTIFLLLVACTGLLVVGACGDDDDGPPDAPAREAPGAPPNGGAGPSAKAPDLEWWRRKPPISLLFTGGQKGKLKPCGCSEPQMGGLVRVASVYQHLQKRARGAGGALAAVSLGWSMKGRGELQEEAKADLLRAVNETLGFDATLLGATDLIVDAMCQPRGTGGPDLPHPPVNVRLAAVNPAVDATPFVDLTVGDLKVRAVSVLEPDVAAQLQAGGFLDGVVSISRAFEGLSPRPDTLWLVATAVQSDATLDTIKAALRRLGAGVIVDVTGTGGAGRVKLDAVVLAPGSEPLVVELDELGKAVGVLDVAKDPDGGGWRVDYRRIDLVPQWEKYPGPLVTEVRDLEALYRTMVKERGYIHEVGRYKDHGASYVGSAACAQCHLAIYQDWQKTSHAKALETLAQIDYAWDPECIRCHVVGWERSQDDWIVKESGFVDPEKTPFLGGVGCENCHGPGSEHVDAPWDDSLFAEGGPNVTKPGKTLCVACHDIENSHGFTEGYEEHFLPKVDHHLVPSDRRVNDPPDDPPDEPEDRGK